MSLTKRSEGYARHMDERFRTDDRDYDLEYREHLYFMQQKRENQRILEATQQPENQPKPNDNVEQRKERN
jgi:hypothetical protein